MTEPSFDVDAFLARALTARLATNGPTVRPVWFLWEEGAFWIMTGPWAHWFTRMAADPLIALVVDTCDTAGGEILQVIAHGKVDLRAWDIERGRRLLVRYLGEDEPNWPQNYRAYLADTPIEGLTWVRLAADKIITSDFSFTPAP
jgi:nitroimidazol reductase NimA-like FMN-containing flavoprotein (pyridoxamine 5'-phosphate oxidase superfamily)